MKILVTGDYASDYNRTRVLLEGLKKNDAIITEMPLGNNRNKMKESIRKEAVNNDILFLPSFTHRDVKFVKKLTNKPLVFDPLISRYLTKVFDYKTVWKYSLRGYKNFLKDKIAFKYSDIILADTHAHKKYYIDTFGLPGEKVQVLPIGAESSVFFPKPELNPKQFTVGFYGSFVPLQGTLNIIEAAHLLKDKDIHFQIIGKGFDFEKAQKLKNRYGLDKVKMKGSIPYEELNNTINSFSICLGIFGTTPKAQLVIPNKIYHYAACGKPIITMDTPAIRELFTDDKDIILSTSDPESIAEKIEKLFHSPNQFLTLGEEALRLIQTSLTEKEIGKTFITIVKKNLSPSYFS